MHVDRAPIPVQMLGKILGIVPNCYACRFVRSGEPQHWCQKHDHDPDPHLSGYVQTCEHWTPDACE